MAEKPEEVFFPKYEDRTDFRFPTIGSIVWHKSLFTPHHMQAALITAVHENDIDLCVFSSNGYAFNQHVTWGDMPGQWSWPKII
jgi:hypothetical protein